MADRRRAPTAGLRPRRIAWEILQRVEAGGYADVLLGHRLADASLDSRDQALVTRVVYSTIAWQKYLDHLLSTWSQRPIAKLDAPIRCLLRMALAQVCLLDRVPDFAAVTTAVELAKSYRGGSASGFVNAVLRKAIGDWRNVPMPDRTAAPLSYLSTRWSHPEWLVRRWITDLGEQETEALLEANNGEAPTTLRVNRTKANRSDVERLLSEAGYEITHGEFSDDALVLRNAPNVLELPGFNDGLFSLQGEASQLVGRIVAPSPGMSVLDLCAAPGGKSLHAAEIMGNSGRVVARDLSARGVALIREHARRLGLSIVTAQVGDAIAWQTRAASEPLYDRVIVDAPCSGLGTLREHPEARWQRTEKDVHELAALQAHILSGASASVAPGGLLIYSTCTLLDEENSDVVAQFLRRHDDFEIDDPRPDLPPAAHRLIDTGGALRTFPHRHGLDGFFAVRLKRQ